MNEGYASTLKSAETEDWLDFHVIRPFCYQLARLFARFDVHPNTVTIWSMFIGAASCVFFAQGSFYYGGLLGLLANVMAIVMLMVADVFDCTDGQLARMTNKKSRMGRILDGVAGFTWFLPIYVALAYRFYYHHDLEFAWFGISDTQQHVTIAIAVVVVLGLVSGFLGLAGQQRLADYYIQIHLFFLKGEKGSELDNSIRQQEIYDQMTKETPLVERVFQNSYIDYTRKQEKVTPQFQKLMAAICQRYGSADQMPADVRNEFLRHSRPLMTWNGLLTFNFRSFWLFLFCLLDVPMFNFVWEIVGMGLIYLYVNHRHEAFCKSILSSIERKEK